MPDNMSTEKRQAEALSAAIDELNSGLPPEDAQTADIAELLLTAKLVKAAAQPAAEPPPAILNHIVEQAAQTITREKRKKRLAWGLAGFSAATAAVLLFAFINLLPPSAPEQQLAKTPQELPAPAAEQPFEPPAITQPPPNLTTPPAKAVTPKTPAKQEPAAPQAAQPQAPRPAQTPPAQPPNTALVPPQSSVPADSGTMLALADRKADAVTIDAAAKIIRQVYRQGAPDEIIITQAPKRAAAARSLPQPPMTMAAPLPNQAAIKAPNRNKVSVTIDNTEVTIEGAASEEELLSLAKTLTRVSIAQ